MNGPFLSLCGFHPVNVFLLMFLQAVAAFPICVVRARKISQHNIEHLPNGRQNLLEGRERTTLCNL